MYRRLLGIHSRAAALRQHDRRGVDVAGCSPAYVSEFIVSSSVPPWNFPELSVTFFGGLA
jgi:hypothetical protein